MSTYRVTNDTDIVDRETARKMLRNKYLQTEDYWPGLNLLEVLLAAYPETELPPFPDGEPGGTDWKKLAWALAMDFVPAFQPGGAPGRPAARQDGLIAAVEHLIDTGVATNITHACNIVDSRQLFPEITDVRKAYYRRRKNLSR